jgi:hypothetical protein
MDGSLWHIGYSSARFPVKIRREVGVMRRRTDIAEAKWA